MVQTMIQGMKVYMATGSLFNRPQSQVQLEETSVNPQQSADDTANNQQLATEPVQPLDEIQGTPHTFRSGDKNEDKADETASDELIDS